MIDYSAVCHHLGFLLRCWSGSTEVFVEWDAAACVFRASVNGRWLSPAASQGEAERVWKGEVNG
jgi:hypothetical protein